MADQITKYVATYALAIESSIGVFPGVSFTLAHNKGAAFSLFSNYPGGQVWVFTCIALSVSCYLIYWLLHLPKKSDLIIKYAITLIIGGALGNVLDRIRWGHVIDFIDVYYKHYHWPIFNVADSAITLGAFLILIDFFSSYSAKKR